MCDRYSGRLSLFTLAKDDSKHIITVLRNYFTNWGIADNLTTDGAPVYTSFEMEEFLAKYEVFHRVSSALGWAEKQKMWNINCEHADSVDIHKTEGFYPATFHFNTMGAMGE